MYARDGVCRAAGEGEGEVQSLALYEDPAIYNSKPKLKYSLDRNRGEDKDEDKKGLLGQR